MHIKEIFTLRIKIKNLFLLLLFLLIIPFSSYADGLSLFNSEQSAQVHCPYDVVVWLNLPTGVWHYKGARWYGMTKHGAFVCQNEAMVAGSRASLNGS